MKKFLAILVVALLSCLAVGAQGTVTVTQSEDIDALVNGKKNTKANKKKPQPQPQGEKTNCTFGSYSTSRASYRSTDTISGTAHCVYAYETCTKEGSPPTYRPH